MSSAGTGLGGPLIPWRSERRDSSEFEKTALVHLDTLYQAALRLTSSRAEAEDIVQETVLSAFRNFHQFNPGTNCRAWLLTILRNVFLNRLRKAEREVLEADPAGWESATPSATALGFGSPEEAFFQTVLHGDVDRALKALPLAFRETVVLVDLEGLSYKEVAGVIGCPMGTVMSRLSRGRHLLRQALMRFAREHGYARDE
jgi:RNA polymerase sigma-70 factor (ECF subfamily)